MGSQPCESLHGPSVSAFWANCAETASAFTGNDFVSRSGRNPVESLRWQQQAGIDDFSRQPAPVATAGLLGVESAARSLQLPSAVAMDNGELHALRGRAVSRSADHCADPALSGIRSFVPASRRRSRHANTESGFRASSRFGAQIENTAPAPPFHRSSHTAHPFFRNPYSPPETRCSCPWTGSSEDSEHTGK